jgi:polyisoprenoid-binding protein YceI
MTRILLLLCFTLGMAGSALAKPRDYVLDPVHSRIAFFVQHAGFSRAIGTFSGIHGTLRFDADAPTAGRVEATIPIDTLELGDPKWRERVLDPTFFEVKRFPEARFVSTGIEAGEDGGLRVRGTLELRGVKRDIVLDARLNRIDRHPLTLRGTAGFSARVVLSRAEFGMDNWKKLVGDEVEVLIEIEATRTQRNRASENEA